MSSRLDAVETVDMVLRGTPVLQKAQREVRRIEAGVQQELSRLLRDGNLSAVEAVFNRVALQTQEIDRLALMRAAALRGEETLTINTAGTRSEEWFASSGRAFSLGIATTYVVVGLFHPDVGIAGSHINTITSRDSALNAYRLYTDRLLSAFFEVSAQDARLRMCVPVSTRVELVERATHEAVERFEGLAEGEIPEGIKVFTYGAFYARPEERVLLGESVHKFYPKEE